MGPCLACEVCRGLMVWIGPSGFQTLSNNQSLRPRSLLSCWHDGGGTLTSSALSWIWSPKTPGCTVPAAGLRLGNEYGTPRVKFQGLWLPESRPTHNPLQSSLPLHHKPRALCPLTAPESTYVCQLGCGACPKSSPGSALEVLSSGTESRGLLRREVREPAGSEDRRKKE